MSDSEPNLEFNFKKYFQILQILHFALLGGQLILVGIFGFMVYYRLAEMGNFMPVPTNIIYLVLLLPAVGVLGSNFLFKMLLGNIPNDIEVKEKLTKYQTALLVRYAILEVPILLILVLYMLTGNQTLLLAVVLGMAYFFMMRPTKTTIIEDLELTQQEQKQL